MIYKPGKSHFKFAQSYFVTELCNVLFCCIKTPVRELNFVSLSLFKEHTS